MPRILGSIGNHPFGTGDGFEKPASLHLVGFLLASDASPKRAGSGALLFNGGHYNRSVLNPAIRVARAGSRFWDTPRAYVRSRAGARL